MWLVRIVIRLSRYRNLNPHLFRAWHTLFKHSSVMISLGRTTSCNQSRECTDGPKLVYYLLTYHSPLNYLFWPTIEKPSYACSKVGNVPHTAQGNAKTVQVINFFSLNWSSAVETEPKATIILRSRSWLQGQRSQDKNSMPMHIYPSCIAHRRRQATFGIPWTQEHLQESQGQGHGSEVRGHRTKIPCSCTPTPHGYSTNID